MLLLSLAAGVECRASQETPQAARPWYSWNPEPDAQQDSPAYGLKQVQPSSSDDLLVVLIHGLNSSPEAVSALLGPTRDAGLACADFAYPNDQPIERSAHLLADELKILATRQAGRRVALVTHSMGGLVARRVVEDRGLDPGNVCALIMVSPPNHGSRLAKFAAAGDLWEHGVARSHGWPWARVADATHDGWGEALRDLRPGSPFLVELNAHSRNRAVGYTILLGCAGSVPPGRVQAIAESTRRSLETVGAKQSASRLARFVRSFPEVVQGTGDGAVALQRGRLAGVPDTLVLPFGHLDVAAENPTPGALEARRVIRDRLLDCARDAADSDIDPDRS